MTCHSEEVAQSARTKNLDFSLWRNYHIRMQILSMPDLYGNSWEVMQVRIPPLRGETLRCTQGDKFIILKFDNTYRNIIDFDSIMLYIAVCCFIAALAQKIQAEMKQETPVRCSSLANAEKII